MLSGVQSGCINHPGMEAATRCKQCNVPVCGKYVVAGPTGNFCSQDCRTRHEAFVQRARELDAQRGVGLMVQVRKFLGAAVVALAVLAVLGIVGSLFEVPILSGIVRGVRGTLGI